MKLLLVRHAIAVPAGTPDVADDERPLTDRGRKRFRKAAAGLAEILDTPDAILTSPLPRAKETAAIAADAWSDVTPIEEPRLAGDHPERVLPDLAAHHDGDHEDALIVLVGHEPHLSRLLGHLVGGAGERLPFKKGGAALVEIDPAAPAAGRLIWFLPPRLLRRLGGD